MLYEITARKYGASFKNVVVSFEVERIIFIHVSVCVHVILYNKSHVTETKVNPVTENDKVMRLGIDSVAIL